MDAKSIIKSVSLVLVCCCAAGAADLTVRLQGRVSAVNGAGTNLVFKTDSGAEYELKRTSNSEALFRDTNLLARVLLVSGVVQENILEITSNLRSIKDGRVFDLFYYCSVCSITSNYPELCQCCQQPVEFREKPAE